MSTATVDAFLAAPHTRTTAAIGDRPAPGTPGTEGPLVEPGSDAWYTTISASKVPAITGTSPWDSPYSLWRRMKGFVAPEGDDDVKSAGRYHEAGIASWLRDQRPELRIRPCGTFTAAGNPRHTAAPDRVAVLDDGTVDNVEIKTSRKPEDWGQPGTDQIPPYYRDQVDWQLHCTGAARCWIAVELPWFEHQLYVVDRDSDRIAALIASVDAFLALLDTDTCPPVDGHKATAQAQREVYAVVDAEEGVDFDRATVAAWLDARTTLAAAEAAERAATAVIVEALAGNRQAKFDGHVFAEWKPWRPGLAPKLYPARKLPTLEAEAPARHLEAVPDPDPIATTAWIVGRLRAIRDSGNTQAVEAVRRYWPDNTPTVPPWTDPQIDAINALLVQAETVDEVPYPPSDPRTPADTEPLVAPAPNTLAARKVTDRTGPATAADTADLKASVAPLHDHQKHRIMAWSGDARRAGRPWTYQAGESSRRIAAINAAAVALVLHAVDHDNNDDTAARYLIERVAAIPAGTERIGVALGSLTLTEARNVTAATQRFAGGDPELTQAVNEHLEAAWAQPATTNTATKEQQRP